MLSKLILPSRTAGRVLSTAAAGAASARTYKIIDHDYDAVRTTTTRRKPAD
jgi:hypothetical protein